MVQLRKNREFEEDDSELVLSDMEVPEFDAEDRINQKIRQEEKEQRAFRKFVRDVCSC